MAAPSNRRLTDEDLAWLNATFAGNEQALKTLRKLFLYEVDPSDPIGISRDMWTTLDLKDLSHEDKLLSVAARQMLITHLEGALQVIKTVAGEKKETPEQMINRLSKDSAK